MSATGELEQPDLLQAVIEAALREIHISLIAHVVRFYPDRRAADVRPVIRAPVMTENDQIETEELPVIQNVPIAYPSGGGWAQTWPLAVGDPVRLLLSEQYTGGYRRSGKEGQEPGFLARFDLSSAVAIPCDERDGRPIEVSTANWIVNGPGFARFGASSAIKVALADLVKSYVDAAIVGHSHPYVSPGGPSVTSAGAYASGAPSVDMGSPKLKAEPP